LQVIGDSMFHNSNTLCDAASMQVSTFSITDTVEILLEHKKHLDGLCELVKRVFDLKVSESVDQESDVVDKASDS
jgi:hypothetical protein